MYCPCKDKQEADIAGTSSPCIRCSHSNSGESIARENVVTDAKLEDVAVNHLIHLQQLEGDHSDIEDIEPNNTSSSEPIVASSSSSCCRICQDTSATTEELSNCHCQCKGQLSRVHRSCLVEWVRYKGSNHCEICGGSFRDIPVPIRGTGVNEIAQHFENMRAQLARYQPISQRKRTTLGGAILFLLVLTGVLGILTIGADSEFHRVSADPSSTDHELKKSHIVFSICLSLLFFCLTLTVGISLMWFLLELYFYIHRRRVLTRAASRMMAEARQRNALWRVGNVV